MALWSGEGSRGSYSFCIEGCSEAGRRGEGPHCMIGKSGGRAHIVILNSKVVVASTRGVLQCHSVVFS